MDVSNNSANHMEELGGQKLIDAVVSLTGLPEREAYQELDQILQLTDQETGELTLDGLRRAMLAYLENLDADISAQSANADKPV